MTSCSDSKFRPACKKWLEFAGNTNDSSVQFCMKPLHSHTALPKVLLAKSRFAVIFSAAVSPARFGCSGGGVVARGQTWERAMAIEAGVGVRLEAPESYYFGCQCGRKVTLTPELQ